MLILQDNFSQDTSGVHMKDLTDFDLPQQYKFPRSNQLS